MSWNISGILNFNSKTFVQKLHSTKNLLVTHCSTIWSKNFHNLQMMNTTCLRNLSNLVKPAFEAYWLKKNPKPVSASCSLNKSLTGLSLSYELNKKVWSCPTFKKRPFDPLHCSALNHKLYTAFSKHCFLYKGDSLHWKTENHFSLEPETWGRKVISFCELHVCSPQALGNNFKS